MFSNYISLMSVILTADASAEEKPAAEGKTTDAKKDSSVKNCEALHKENKGKDVKMESAMEGKSLSINAPLGDVSDLKFFVGKPKSDAAPKEVVPAYATVEMIYKSISDMETYIAVMGASEAAPLKEAQDKFTTAWKENKAYPEGIKKVVLDTVSGFKAGSVDGREKLVRDALGKVDTVVSIVEVTDASFKDEKEVVTFATFKVKSDEFKTTLVSIKSVEGKAGEFTVASLSGGISMMMIAMIAGAVVLVAVIGVGIYMATAKKGPSSDLSNTP